MKLQFLITIYSLFIFACTGNIKDESKIEIEKIAITQEEEKVFFNDTVADSLLEKEGGDKISAKRKNSKTMIISTKETETVGEIIETAEKALPTVEEIRANHEAWDDLTKKYVSTFGKVNYRGIKDELVTIKAYLSHLEKTSPTAGWSKNEKLAYWINLYNVSTVYLVTSNYPVKTITEIAGGKPWDKKFIKSGEKVYSLNDIENLIIRPQFKDPRVHAALNCAAKSCPILLNGAYISSNLNNQLDQQVRKWINDSSKNKLEGNKAQLSQIFDWYKADFKDGVVTFINDYISTNVALQENAQITFLEYNWALNE